MKVIFIKDVKNQGRAGEIKEVKDGYAQNFLIKNKYAVAYTKRSKEVLDISNKNKEEQENDLIKKCTEIKNKLEKEVVSFSVKAGKNDQVFGTISTKQISNKLTELGYLIDKKKIIIDSPISSLGYHKVKISLHKKVEAVLTINLIK